MINPIDAHPIATTIHQSPHHEAAGPAALVPADVVSMSPQALDGLLNEDLTLAFNAAAPDAASRTPPSPTAVTTQLQTAAQNVAANPDFFTYLMNALGGPHFVAALMTSQQAGTPTEPLSRAIPPLTPTRTA